MNYRKSERFDSTAEVGELKPYEESVEGSESSKHWLAIVKHGRCIDIGNRVNEKVANSIATLGVVQGAERLRSNNVLRSRVR